MIIAVGYVFLASGCSRPANRIQKEPAPKIAKLNLEAEDKREIDALLEGLKKKNPFRPDHASGIIPAEKSSVELKGIIWDPQKPYALIGEAVVMTGDYVGGKRVVKINRNSVVLDNNGSEEVLRLEGKD